MLATIVPAADIDEAKRAAIAQWTGDPCGARLVSTELGTPAYFAQLRAARHAMQPWMAELLGYDGAAGLQVLDVGCGQGIDVVGFALAGARVTGVDITPRHVELAQSHLRAAGVADRAEILLGDAENLPVADGSQDLVISNGVLHHTPEFARALDEIHRVLRPGGQTVIIVYNRYSLHYWCNQVLLYGILRRQLWREGSMHAVLSRNVEFSRTGARPLVRVYGRRELQRMLRNAGFTTTRLDVRQYQLTDAFLISLLSKALPVLKRPAVLEWLGRRAGWYLIARARRDGSSAST